MLKLLIKLFSTKIEQNYTDYQEQFNDNPRNIHPLVFLKVAFYSRMLKSTTTGQKVLLAFSLEVSCMFYTKFRLRFELYPILCINKDSY